MKEWDLVKILVKKSVFNAATRIITGTIACAIEMYELYRARDASIVRVMDTILGFSDVF